MTLQIRILTVITGLMLAGNSLAADNASLVNKAVRVMTLATAGPVSGKLIAVEGCLYVQFDQKTKDGLTSVRLDQVTSLQTIGGGASPSLQTMLSQEPRKCFVEGAG